MVVPGQQIPVGINQAPYVLVAEDRRGKNCAKKEKQVDIRWQAVLVQIPE